MAYEASQDLTPTCNICLKPCRPGVADPGGVWICGCKSREAVNHPSHYGGADNPYECIKVVQAWGLSFELGNAVKYISRAGKKDSAKTIEDLKKSVQYLQFEIAKLEKR